ncbi:hypothetical protein [Fusobacterium vincentii ATCC 49256]|uniref:Uncharacterized protein n=1 Tax=Fusobacterium vincentii ATCC 49256 TaxID=209882 RepID=Q7P3J0_FUSVC|nr:hypothetical protein [Fusobacterium vincentii ATCC 49256]
MLFVLVKYIIKKRNRFYYNLWRDNMEKEKKGDTLIIKLVLGVIVGIIIGWFQMTSISLDSPYSE